MKRLNDLIDELIALKNEYGNIPVLTVEEIGYGESRWAAPSPHEEDKGYYSHDNELLQLLGENWSFIII